jgi:hypothetical protein
LEKKVTGRRIARLAWGSLFSAARAMPLIFLAAIGLLVALEFGSGFLSTYLPRGMLVDPLFTVAIAFAQLTVLAAVAVPVHRFILLGESGMTLHPAIILRSAAWLMPFYLALLMLPKTGISSGDPVTSLLTMLSWASGIALVWIFLLFPAIAVGEESDGRQRVETAIRRARGRFWLILRSLLITLTPVVLALPVMVVALNAMQAPPVAPDAAAITPVMLWLIQAGGWAILVLVAALGAAASAWLYSHLTESHLINEF